MKVSELNENLEGDALYANLIKQQFPLGAGYDLNSGMTHEMWYRELKLARRWLATVVRAGEIDPPVSIGNDFTIRDQNGQNIGIPGQWNPSMKPKSAKPLAEDGRIVKGVNTTVDVGTNEIPRQARKFGFTVDKDGRPPTLSRKVKGKSTNVLYNLGLAESVQSIKFRMPNFDAEWSEAERYSEFKKIGKDKWIELAKKGKPVDIDNAMSNNINNTEAGEKDRAEFDKLDSNKRDRFVKDLVNNNIELPIIARYSDGHLELVGGNTRLTGMMSQLGQGKAWIFDVPDEVANLAESKQNLNEAIQFWPLIAAAFIALSKKKGVKRAKAIMSEFMRRLPPGAGYAEIVDLIKIVGGMTAGYQTGKAVLGKKDDVDEATVDDIASASEIYVDMDGVLADFFGDWKKLIGKDWRKITDIGPALQKIRDTDDFWLKLPMTSNAKNLLSLIKNIKGSYKILSSPLPDDPNSEPHKREWIKSNLNFFPPEDVIITFDKAKFATQSDGTPNILIDDYGVNIQKWESAGGVGFKHKDHKFERTARNIQAHMTQPVKENKYADLGHKKPKNLDVDLKLPNGDKKVLRADDKDHIRGLVVRSNADGSYDSYYWYNDPTRKVPIEITIDGKSVSKNAKNIHWKFHPELNEGKWSEKYKKSINCSNPKGFSQKAHCAGRKKRNENYERSQLPQIKSHDLQYVDHEFMLLPIDAVVPVQKERIMENFKKQVDRIVIGQYTPIVVDCENRIVNGHHRYDAVRLLGEKYIQVAKIPHSIECLIENFADGKKKGRKGLAKRSGVNCKQSISKLRKIAKNSTGERRRMAHWCANMKSGRKK